MKKILRQSLIVAVLLAGHCATAGNAISTDGFAVEKIFQSGQWEMSVNAGPLFAPFIVTRGRPTLNQALGGVQFGWMINDLNSAGPFRGNWEMMPEIFGSKVWDGPGSYIVGSTLWFRYNFVPDSWRVVPYAQAGGGVVLSDIDHDIVERDFNFNLGIAFGFRVLFARNWSLNLEYRYQHISNGGLSEHNDGLNSHGPILGVSYFF